jgi:hypothetical protein
MQTDMQTDKRYGDEYGCEYGRQVYIYTGLLASRDQPINKAKEASKVTPNVKIVMIEKLNCFSLRGSLYARIYGIKSMPCTHVCALSWSQMTATQ